MSRTRATPEHMKRGEPLAPPGRFPGEHSRAVATCNAFLILGPSRSFWWLRNRLKELDERPPTQKTTRKWADKYHWMERAENYDQMMIETIQARREEAMASGLALNSERVIVLKQITEILLKNLDEIEELAEDVPDPDAEPERSRLWLRDFKQVGRQVVEIRRYNSNLISDIRGLLDDLAKETGGRVTKTDVTSGGQSLAELKKWKDTQAERQAAFDGEDS